VSRDPERTPFQWDNTTSAGFSTNTSTWLPVSPNYKSINVKNQLAANMSHLKVFKELTALRRNSSTLKEGSLETFSVNKTVFVVLRQLQNSESYITVANLGSNQEKLNLDTIASSLPDTLEYVLVDSLGGHKKG
jgi:alpha-glucosidase